MCRRVTDIMGETSTACHEQALGVAQVGEACLANGPVNPAKRSLVEEVAAAASSLRSQANDLVQVVAVFKLGADTQGRAAMPAAMRSHQLNVASFKGTDRRGSGVAKGAAARSSVAQPSRASAPAAAKKDANGAVIG